MAAAEEEGHWKDQLKYVPEVVLKKRKHKEESIALNRKTQLQLGKQGGGTNKRKSDDIRRPEDFVLEFRNQELDLVRMKNRTKRLKSKVPSMANSKLLFVVRIQGKSEMHPRSRKTMYSLNLRKMFQGVFVKATAGVIERLQRVEPYVTYGYPNLKNIRELIYKKGHGKIGHQRVPLIDNNIIEQAFGKYNILCLEDIVHEIANLGPHFKEINDFLGSFELNQPKDLQGKKALFELNQPKDLQGKKALFKDGGDAGNREDNINDLIDKMN